MSKAFFSGCGSTRSRTRAERHLDPLQSREPVATEHRHTINTAGTAAPNAPTERTKINNQNPLVELRNDQVDPEEYEQRCDA
jgi:hypothetical protein